MSAYQPQPGVGPGRPACRNCGAAWRLHRNPILDSRPLEQHEPRHPCPTAYRPDTLEVAQRELAAAEASGDANRIFVARGEVQRLAGRAGEAPDLRWAAGRPACSSCHERPVYLAGLCGPCYAGRPKIVEN